MADQYLTVSGIVQKFKDKPAVNVREANGQTVRDVTIKAFVSQKLVRVTFWPELSSVELDEGATIFAEGKFSTSGDNNQFLNLSAFHASSIPSGRKDTREVVNQQPAATNAAAPAADTGGADAPPPF